MGKRHLFLPPVSYQGGKQRIAGLILDAIGVSREVFHDFCCGSGAVSVELVRRGYPPDLIHMLDWSPWGLVWSLVGRGQFDMDRLRGICDQIPKDRREIKCHLEELSRKPAEIDTPYVYLLLQAGSFGGKAIWIEGGRWRNCSFRSHWEPTATSNRRSPVNPMMPMPDTLLSRMEVICDRMRGVTGHHCDIREVRPDSGVVYIDPPYRGTTFYGRSFDVAEYAASLSVPVYVSEGYDMGNAVLISHGRRKGGISGIRSEANCEYLSRFNVPCSVVCTVQW